MPKWPLGLWQEANLNGMTFQRLMPTCIFASVKSLVLMYGCLHRLTLNVPCTQGWSAAETLPRPCTEASLAPSFFRVLLTSSFNSLSFSINTSPHLRWVTSMTSLRCMVGVIVDPFLLPISPVPPSPFPLCTAESPDATFLSLAGLSATTYFRALSLRSWVS